jgi:molybdenum cofactor sulfurtransferase
MYSNNGNSYKETIETLRNSSEFTHLTNEVYLDYAANGVYMTSLVKEYALKLAPQTPQTSCSLFSNPHSHSQSGSYTNMFIELTREKILNMFNTTQNEYDLVYVHNVTDGLKLLADNFNFNFQEEEEEVKESNIDESSCFVYLNDNHTSVLGMREIVTAANVYCAFESDSFKDSLDLTLVKSKKCYSKHRQRHLFVYPAQSNFNGRKYAFDLLEKVKSNALMMKRSNFYPFIFLIVSKPIEDNLEITQNILRGF